MKKIVIGLMDRLSSYGTRDEDATSPEDRLKAEHDATAKLLEKMKLKDDTKDAASESGESASNGVDSETTTVAASEGEDAKTLTDSNGDAKGIPADVKLYEIFFDQVTNLVKTRALPIQDTMALLTSLINLALYVYRIL